MVVPDATVEESRGADAAQPAPLPQVAIIALKAGLTNGAIVEAWRSLGLDVTIVSPYEATTRLGPDTLAIVRLDVLETLDGVEPGLEKVWELERRGQRSVNSARALLGAHDKLLTAKLLVAAGIPHPRTAHMTDPAGPLPLEPPVVIKPRFGSWGRDVFRCSSPDEARACLVEVAGRSWFVRYGALVQELVGTSPSDLRVLVAGGRVVGAGRRTPAPGQWRTNVSLGARIESVAPAREAADLAVRAAAAIGAGFVGVDLLSAGRKWIVLELNGAVDFDERYSLPGRDVFRDLAEALGLRPV